MSRVSKSVFQFATALFFVLHLLLGHDRHQYTLCPNPGNDRSFTPWRTEGFRKILKNFQTSFFRRRLSKAAEKSAQTTREKHRSHLHGCGRIWFRNTCVASGTFSNGHDRFVDDEWGEDRTRTSRSVAGTKDRWQSLLFNCALFAAIKQHAPKLTARLHRKARQLRHKIVTQ